MSYSVFDTCTTGHGKDFDARAVAWPACELGGGQLLSWRRSLTISVPKLRSLVGSGTGASLSVRSAAIVIGSDEPKRISTARL